MPAQPMDRRHVWDPLGLVAGLCDALGRGDVMDRATHQHPAMRDLTVGAAVNAMGLNGRGGIHQARALVPRFFPHQPTSRLMAPRVAPAQRNDEALGRALDTLSADGVTALDRLMAATAAKRLGLTPASAPLDRTRCHVDGRDNSDEAPADTGVPIPQGDRRDPRPDLNHVM